MEDPQYLQVSTSDVVMDVAAEHCSGSVEGAEEGREEQTLLHESPPPVNKESEDVSQEQGNDSEALDTQVDYEVNEVDDKFSSSSLTVNTSAAGTAGRFKSPHGPGSGASDRRKLSPHRSSNGSDSFGSSAGHSLETIDTFNTSLASTRSYDSPSTAFRDKNSFSTPESPASSRASPNSRGLGNIVREDSFDRSKHTYKTTHSAQPKMERAKVLGVNEYTFLRTLGKGAFAEVKLATKSKLENDDVVRDLDVDNFERYAIKIIKKNFLQEKRKFQAVPSPACSRRSSSSPSVTFLPSLVAGENSTQLQEQQQGTGDKQGDKQSIKASPPRASGRSLRMKNKRFQTANSASNLTPPASSLTPPTTSLTPPASSSGNSNSDVDPSPPPPTDITPPPVGRSITEPVTPHSTTSTSTVTPNSVPHTPKHPEPPPVSQEVLQEIEVLKYLRHKNLVKLCEIIDDPASKHLYIVMEYVPAGPIMIRDGPNGSFISRLTGGVLLESMASKVFRDLMSVLEYLHLNHIAHRDLKPDNLLVDYRGNLKVSDFGVSSHFSGEKQKKAVNLRQLSRSKSRGVVNNTEGTFAFYSPEMCRESSGAYSAYMSDVWAASVCLWIFIFGQLPLYSADIVDLFAMIRRDKPVMPHRVSPELTHLFDRILQKDQEDRLSIHDIQNHCWLKRIPLRGNGISSDDFETSDDLSAGSEDVRRALPPGVVAKTLRWASAARDKCAQRSRQYEEDMHRELVAMLKRSSLAFKDDEQDDDAHQSSDDDDPLARLVSYDDINGSVLEDIKKHEERVASLQKMTSLAEGDEGRSPVLLQPRQPKKALRTGRKSRGALDEYLQDSSSSLGDSVTPRPTLDIHERLTQESIVALELEAFTLNTNKQLATTKEHEPEARRGCCSVS